MPSMLRGGEAEATKPHLAARADVTLIGKGCAHTAPRIVMRHHVHTEVEEVRTAARVISFPLVVIQLTPFCASVLANPARLTKLPYHFFALLLTLFALGARLGPSVQSVPELLNRSGIISLVFAIILALATGAT